MPARKKVSFRQVDRCGWTPEEDANILKWSKNPVDEDGGYHWLTEAASERAWTLNFRQIVKKYRPYWNSCNRKLKKALKRH